MTTNAFALYCLKHGVDTEDYSSMSRAWSAFESVRREEKRALRRDYDAELAQERSGLILNAVKEE